MLEAKKWYKCKFLFQLDRNLDVTDKMILDIAGEIGKQIKIKGRIADLNVIDEEVKCQKQLSPEA